MNKTTRSIVILLLIGLVTTTSVPLFISQAAAADSWTLVNDARAVGAYPALREYVWQKNASMAPNDLYDKIGLHRLVNTAMPSLGVVFILPGFYSSGENRISNPPESYLIINENYSEAMYWANRGFEVYSIDYRMHFVPANLNASQLSFMANWGIDQMMSDLKEGVNKAKEVSGVTKIFMLGMSAGGNWAQYYAAKNWQEDLRGLVLLDPGSKATMTKNQILKNSLNITAEVEKMNQYGNWSWENPQLTNAPSPLNPGYLFLAQYAALNPTAPAKWPNGTLLQPTINPRTNTAWANISDWFEYRANNGATSNTYGGYGNNTIQMFYSAGVDRYMPAKCTLDSAAMMDWNISPYISYDFLSHVKEVNVPVIGFRSGLSGIPSYGTLTNGMATTDFTSIVLPNYGHGDVFQGIYCARDVSEPTYQWMLAHLPPPVNTFASASSPSVTTGQTTTLTATASGGTAPYTYQWYEGTTLLSGQTSAQLTVTKTTSGTYTYYATIMDSERKTANTNTLTIQVNLPSTSAPTPVPTSPSPTPAPVVTATPTPTNTVPSPSPSITETTSYMIIGLPNEATYAIIGIAIIALIAAITLTFKKRKK
jgi:pimeloyl-ACP methyl ester carboxylesterase